MIRTYFKNTRVIAITEAILQLRGLILMPFLTRRFGVLNYGVWSQVSVLITTVTPLMVLGTDSGFIRLVPGNKMEDQKRTFSAWLIFQFVMALFFGTLIVLFSSQLADLIFGTGGQEYKRFLLLAALWLFTSSVINITRSWFKAQNSVNQYSASVLIQAILNTAAAVVMLLRSEGPYEMVSYSLIADAILAGGSLLFILARFGMAPPDFGRLRGLIKFGLPLVPASFATWGLNYIDRFFIVGMTSITAVGIYAVAYRIAYQVIPLLAKPWWVMFSNSVAELHNKGEKDTVQRLFNYTVGLTLALGVPASAGLFLVGDRLLRIFATDQFLSGVPVLFLISSAYLYPMIEGYFINMLGLVYKQAVFTVTSVIALIVNVGLNFILIPKYSIVGAALATNVAYLISLMLTIIFSIRYQAVKTNFLFPLKILLATLVMFVTTRIVDNLIVNGLNKMMLELILLIALATVVYGLNLWILGILDRARIMAALSILRSPRN